MGAPPLNGTLIIAIRRIDAIARFDHAAGRTGRNGCLPDWAPDEKLRHRILVENPAVLYGFPETRDNLVLRR
jgi:hypothetical protein